VFSHTHLGDLNETILYEGRLLSCCQDFIA
jgi:hypothetical protein